MSKRGVPVLIDGQAKIFRFNLNALASLEDEIGVPILQMKAEKFGFKEQRAMVWAGLLHAEPKLTVLEVGELLDPIMENPAGWGALQEKVWDAFGMAFPEVKKDEGGDPNVQSATSTSGTT